MVKHLEKSYNLYNEEPVTPGNVVQLLSDGTIADLPVKRVVGNIGARKMFTSANITGSNYGYNQRVFKITETVFAVVFSSGAGTGGTMKIALLQYEPSDESWTLTASQDVSSGYGNPYLANVSVTTKNVFYLCYMKAGNSTMQIDQVVIANDLSFSIANYRSAVLDTIGSRNNALNLSKSVASTNHSNPYFFVISTDGEYYSGKLIYGSSNLAIQSNLVNELTAADIRKIEEGSNHVLLARNSGNNIYLSVFSGATALTSDLNVSKGVDDSPAPNGIRIARLTKNKYLLVTIPKTLKEIRLRVVTTSGTAIDSVTSPVAIPVTEFQNIENFLEVVENEGYVSLFSLNREGTEASLTQKHYQVRYSDLNGLSIENLGVVSGGFSSPQDILFFSHDKYFVADRPTRDSLVYGVGLREMTFDGLNGVPIGVSLGGNRVVLHGEVQLPDTVKSLTPERKCYYDTSTGRLNNSGGVEIGLSLTGNRLRLKNYIVGE